MIDDDRWFIDPFDPPKKTESVVSRGLETARARPAEKKDHWKISHWLTNDQYNKLIRAAANNNVTVGSLLHQAIEKMLKSLPELPEEA